MHVRSSLFFPESKPRSVSRRQPSPHSQFKAPDSPTKAYTLAIQRWCIRRLVAVAEAAKPRCRWRWSVRTRDRNDALSNRIRRLSPRAMAFRTASKSVTGQDLSYAGLSRKGFFLFLGKTLLGPAHAGRNPQWAMNYDTHLFFQPIAIFVGQSFRVSSDTRVPFRLVMLSYYFHRHVNPTSSAISNGQGAMLAIQPPERQPYDKDEAVLYEIYGWTVGRTICAVFSTPQKRRLFFPQFLREDQVLMHPTSMFIQNNFILGRTPVFSDLGLQWHRESVPRVLPPPQY
ncbi:kinase-like domain-containing protein [Zalerion maritima]|uniref:Kinase-like domain-containing protein n=1 Tax=Zalerion maritima TaxID=339359 RepID=A0AAD5RQX4_9PEZI|nr:kinase-like domain-containing protein [Zalerion maritima]